MSQKVNDNVKKDSGKSDSVSTHLFSRPSRSRTLSNGPLLSKIRNFNHLALNSIGSFFSANPLSRHVSSTRKGDAEYADSLGTASKLKEEQPNSHNGSGFGRENHDTNLTPFAGDYQERQAEDNCSVKPLPQSKYEESFELPPASELTNSHHSEPHISTRLSEFRSLFGHLSRSRRELGYLAHGGPRHVNSALNEPTSSDIDYKSSATSTSLASNATSFSSPCCNDSFSSAYSYGQWMTPLGPDSIAAKTPPLTLDSFNSHTIPSLSLSLECSGHLSSAYNLSASGNSEDILARPGEKSGEDNPEEGLCTSSNLWEVKEGKKPERLSVRSVLFAECCI